jgi:hypothetical protein
MGFLKKKTHPADEKHNVITEREHESIMKNIISEKDLTAQAVGFVKEGPHCSKENVMGFLKKTDPDVKERHY